MAISDRPLKLSYDLSTEGPLPHTIPPVEIKPYYRVSEDGANVFVITFANHSGTHIDAPNHVAPGGRALTDFSLEEFRFHSPACIDLALQDDEMIQPEHLEAQRNRIMHKDVLLIRTGYSYWRSVDPERYRFHGPGFSIAAAEYVRAELPELRCIGMDTISFACIAHLEEGMEAHRVLLCPADSHFLLIEDLNLDHDLSNLKRLELHPWLIVGVDSAPCSAVAIVAA